MRILTVSILLFLYVSLMYSQSIQTTDLYLGAGCAIPGSPHQFSEYSKTGYYYGGGIGYSISTNLSLVFSICGYLFPLDKANILSQFTVFDGTLSISGGNVSGFEIAGGIKYLLNQASEKIVSPYFLADVGYSTIRQSDITITYTNSQFGMDIPTNLIFETMSVSSISASCGFGIDISLKSFTTFFLEGRYKVLFTKGENTTFLPIRGGVKLSL